MKYKKIIFLILFLSFIFYLHRINVELKSKTIGIIMNYKTFLTEFYEDNNDINIFLDKLLKFGILNICIFPSDIEDLREEYNEIFLSSGGELNLLFNTQKFRQEIVYLAIPNRLINIIFELDKYKSKTFYKEYQFFGFTDNLPNVKNIAVSFKHKFEDELALKNILVFRLQNKPLLKNIDNYIIKKANLFYLSDLPEKREEIYKIHRMNKILYQKEDIQICIDEYHRAIIERNVKGVLLTTLYYDNKAVKLSEYVPELIKKIKKNGYKISSLSRINKVNNKFNLPYFLESFLSIFYIIFIFIFFYFINETILKWNRSSSLNFKNLLLFLGYILIGGITVSNLLFSPNIFLGIINVKGIKLSLLLPFVLWIYQYIKFNKYKLNAIFKLRITLSQFILINTALLLAVILIIRSGNYNWPASTIELKFRQFLENIFFVRPRFKELIFYPFLFLLFFNFKMTMIKKNFFIIYFFGLIAVSTTINSFLHISTLSYYTIIRTLISMGFALILIGSVLLSLNLKGKIRHET